MNYTPQHLSRWQRPRNYIGAEWRGYFVAPVTRNRDSSIPDNVNWDSQWAILKPLMADFVDFEGEPSVSPSIVSENHWAVGWAEWVAIHESNEAALRAADALAERLESYPVLDEDALSAAEWKAYGDAWESYGAGDFRRDLVAAFELSEATQDALESVDDDALRELYEQGRPSGEFYCQEGDGIRLFTKHSADSRELSRDVFARFLRKHRRQPVSA